MKSEHVVIERLGYPVQQPIWAPTAARTHIREFLCRQPDLCSSGRRRRPLARVDGGESRRHTNSTRDSTYERE